MSRPHPYIPNAEESITRQMLREIGARTIEDLYRDIPHAIRRKGSLAIPSKASEMEARRQVEGLLNKNLSTRDVLSFLGGGIWPHHVPAAVDGDQPGRIPNLLHAIPTRNLARNATGHVRISKHDLRANRNGLLQQLVVRLVDCAGRGSQDDFESDSPCRVHCATLHSP